MTDRHAGYVVILEQDIRDDDAQAIIDAIGMVKGVLTVRAVITTPELHIAEVRANASARDAMIRLAGEFA